MPWNRFIVPTSEHQSVFQENSRQPEIEKKLHRPWFAWTGLIAVGFTCGVAVTSWNLSEPAQADSLTRAEAESIYRELDAGGSPLADTSRFMAKIAQVVTPSVVHIQSVKQLPGRGKLEETGSGVIITTPKRAGTYVITNRHVINHTLAELSGIAIQLHDGRVVHPTRAWDDRYSDVAVLEIESTDLHGLRWGDSDELAIGNVVLACGSPFGYSQSVTMGIISARGRRAIKGHTSGVLNQDFLQTDAAINPGNSGGPLIDLQGRLVGINTAIASTHGGNEGIGFSIPSNLVRTVVEQLLEFNEVRRAYLGVKLDDEFDYPKAQKLRLARIRGARVLEVYPNTPAHKAHLQYNDVIMKFGGHDVVDESHLINVVSLSPVGKSVEVMVWRDGELVRLTVDLMGRPSGTDE